MGLQRWRQLIHYIPLAVASIWALFYTEIWPVLPAGFLATLLLILYDSTQLSVEGVVSESIVAGLIYRATIWIATPSMIGMDPDKYAVAISVISDEGVGAISDLGFYGITPIYHLFNVLVMDVSGLSPATALQFTSVLLYAIVPVIIVAHLARRLSGERAAKLGSVLATAGAASIVYATLTIPQGVMQILWYIVATILITAHRDSARTVVLVTLVGIMAGLHKLGALLALGSVAAIAAINPIGAIRDDRVFVPQNLVHYLLIAGLVFTLQMVWLTGWIKGVVFKLTYFVAGSTVQSNIEASAATRTGGLDIVIFEHGSWIVLLLAAGIAGSWILYTRKDRQTAGLLGVSGVSALLIAGAVASPFSLSLQRAIGIGEPFFIILAVIGAVALSRRTNRSVAPAIVGLLLITQLASTGAVPDHPAEVQEYLTDDEVEAKQWANTHLDQEIYGHYFVAQEITEFDGERATYKTGKGGGFPKGWSPASEYLVTGNLSGADGCFFLRKGQDRVRYNGLYRLNYNPITRLKESDRTKVFENSDAVVYC
ncbi:hypothetical protein [Natrinema pallidum]|uniref:Glycosyltransferase RgtA/B/C/D-like domain-containing protein n=1 Tax=Natrinema pallidum TaxID=69527 RepID=A0A4P9TJI1_9EURY|nr:hypothetical protein [Natrinema pallidum]QCW05073.1 hypothetical protein FGF80_17595 [Natrinema pallidum]